MRRWVLIAFLSALVSSAVSAGVIIALPYISPSRAVAPATAAPAPVAAGTSAPPAEPKGASPGHAEPWWALLAGKIAWPAALLAALAMIGWNSRLRRVFGAGTRLVRKVSAGGVAMEISAEAVDEIRDKLRGSFRELVGSARDEFERMADLQDLDRHLEAVVEGAVLPRIAGGRPTGLRATIHVRDIVFKDYLYQLVDYHPLGGGAHRRFSLRYGIIGRSWRSGKSHGTGNAFGSGASTDTLIEEWGMTRDETHGVLNARPSCLSILLRVGAVPVGILYIDSSDRDAFGDTASAERLVTALETDTMVVDLAQAVERTLAPLRVGGPNLDLKELGR
jgi:hypothetical protein